MPEQTSDEIVKGIKAASSEGLVFIQREIEAALQKHNCSMIARPSYRFRDDSSWSLITAVEVVASPERQT